MSLNWLKLFLPRKKSVPARKRTASSLKRATLELLEMEGRLCPSAYAYTISTSSTTTISGPGIPGGGSSFIKGNVVEFNVSVMASAAGETDEKLTISSSDGSLPTQSITVGTTETFNCVIATNNATFLIDSTSFDGNESSVINVSTNQEELKFLAQPLEGAPDSSIISSGGRAVTVEVLNQNGSLDTAFYGNVTVAIAHNGAVAGGSAVLSGTLTQVAHAGIATFNNLNINEVSQTGLEYTLSAALDDGTQAISNGFTIGQTLAFTTQPANVAAEYAIYPAVVVSVDEPDGTTLDTSYNGPVTLGFGNNPNGSNAQLEGTEMVNAVNGVATFDFVGISMSGVGYSLEASIPQGETAISNPFNVGDYLEFLQQPTNALAGQTIAPEVTVEVLSPNGLPDTTTAGETITLTIEHDASGQGATLGGTLTKAVVSTSGVATFSDLTLNDLGTGYTLLATLGTATQNNLGSVVSDPFTISSPPPPPSLSLAFSPQPATAPVGFGMNPVVVEVEIPNTHALDAAYNGPVTLQINPTDDPSNGTALLSGNTSITVNAINGSAVFNNLSIDTEDNGYSLLASIAGGIQQTSNSFNIISDSAYQNDVLAFKVQPGNTLLGQVIKAPVVDVNLPNGKLDTSFNGVVSITIDVDPNGQSQLVGTAEVNAVKGVATFGNLRIDQAGTGFQLEASLNAAIIAISEPFNITAISTRKPTVVGNPVSQSSLPGGDVTYSSQVLSTATPKIQWEESTNGFKTFTTISDGISSNTVGSSTITTLNLSDVAASMNGQQYRVVFTSGAVSIASTPASLTVLVAPAITKNPASATVSASGTTTFTAAASGTLAPTVQWEESTDGGITFNEISDTNASIKNASSANGTTTTLTIAKAGYTEDKQEFIAVFTNALGNVESGSAILTVHFSPIITVQPVIQKVASGGEATFTAAAIGNPAIANVTWEVLVPMGKTYSGSSGTYTYTEIPGGLSSTLTLTATPSSLNGFAFYAVFTAPNASGKGTVKIDSKAVLLEVGVPVIQTNPQSQESTVGSTVHFTAGATGSPNPKVQWQMSTNGGLTFTNIPNATATTLSFKTTASESGYLYRAVFTNALGSATTNAAGLTLDGPPVIIDQPISQTVQNGTTAIFTALAAGFPVPTVQWYESTDGGAIFTAVEGGTSAILNFETQATDVGKTYEFYAVYINSFTSTKTSTVELIIT